MKNLKHIIFILLLFSVLSCDKYLSIEPKGVRLLSTIEDYNLWLESDVLQTQVPIELNYLGDTKDLTNLTNPPLMGMESLYTWQKQFSQEPKATPLLWAQLYKVIYYYNTVIAGIDNAVGGTRERQQNLKAEALIGRAFTYLQLVNLYGKVYNETTSATDLAVPFVTSNDLSTPTPKPSTVKEIYANIIEDITQALPNLPANNNSNRFRGSVAAGYSILARTYLYMGKYQEAAANALLATEQGQSKIVDYSTLTAAASIPNIKKREDVLFARYLTSRGAMEFPVLDLLKSYNTKDKRLNLFFSNNPVMPLLPGYNFVRRGVTMYWPGGMTMTGTYSYPNCGTSVAEMRLIIAEAAARSGDLAKASDQLHEVRKCRFPSANYERFNSDNKEAMIEAVLKERVFEFPFHGMRWFDMRRLAAEGRIGAVMRYDANNNVVATLEPTSDRYTLEIPMQVLYFNPSW